MVLPWSVHGAPATATQDRVTPTATSNSIQDVSTHTQEMKLGASTVELTGPWNFHTGDNMAWAQPGFNDSDWGKMDLTPPNGANDPFLGAGGFVPGWTERGYPRYSGYAWYRLRVNLQTGDPGLAKSGLALKMPDDLDDAYQVYVNGQLVGQFGRFSPKGVTPYLTLPQAFNLPPDLRGGPMTIAIRMWMDPATPLINPDTGGLHGPPVLGLSAPVYSMLRLDWSMVDRSQASKFAEIAILLLALVVISVLYWLDRRERAYVWLALTLGGIVLQSTVSVISNYKTWIPASVSLLITDAILRPVLIGLWVLFWAGWFRLGRMARLRWMVWAMVVGLSLSMVLLRAPLYGRLIPVNAAFLLLPLSLMLKLFLGGLLVWVTWEGIRKDAAGGWLVLPAVTLVFVSLYQQDLLILHIPLSYFPFGYAVGIGQIGVVVSLNMITVLLMRRFLRSLQQREHLQLEVEQAREVQQLMIPEEIPTIPGYVLESEYRPALQVGGDFFQILPDGAGGVMIVLGDVTGKGLQAGMLVALIVGAIRTIVETSFEPAYVLEVLNRRLCDRAHACATCVALHVSANGETTVSNAGHLAPYLNRKEIPMEGNLPLGLTESVQFEQVHVTLQPGDRLTVLTDGVVEARSESGELFGFNHARAISHLPAAFIARAAQIFGQDDDITVLSICRKATDDTQKPGTVPMTARAAEA